VRRGRLVVHGHFYQPERRDPFSGLIPVDPAAAPYPDWTSRIADECYGPNAERGNFSRISWNIGPALASWLRTERPRTHELIRKQASADTGIATAFHHTILPLASPRDRRTEIRWGLRDFELRFGRRRARQHPMPSASASSTSSPEPSPSDDSGQTHAPAPTPSMPQPADP